MPKFCVALTSSESITPAAGATSSIAAFTTMAVPMICPSRTASPTATSHSSSRASVPASTSAHASSGILISITCRTPGKRLQDSAGHEAFGRLDHVIHLWDHTFSSAGL